MRQNFALLSVWLAVHLCPFICRVWPWNSTTNSNTSS